MDVMFCLVGVALLLLSFAVTMLAETWMWSTNDDSTDDDTAGDQQNHYSAMLEREIARLRDRTHEIQAIESKKRGKAERRANVAERRYQLLCKQWVDCRDAWDKELQRSAALLARWQRIAEAQRRRLEDVQALLLKPVMAKCHGLRDYNCLHTASTAAFLSPSELTPVPIDDDEAA